MSEGRRMRDDAQQALSWLTPNEEGGFDARLPGNFVSRHSRRRTPSLRRQKLGSPAAVRSRKRKGQRKVIGSRSSRTDVVRGRWPRFIRSVLEANDWLRCARQALPHGSSRPPCQSHFIRLRLDLRLRSETDVTVVQSPSAVMCSVGASTVNLLLPMPETFHEFQSLPRCELGL
ncbi:hypothetical protein ANO11243_043520 [Dothideomycetidae sp. 11243]|nr:hypothetical protein ANO11243_043520 [fungal sp. No.11243]